MKNLDLMSYGVVEMGQQEMLMIEGGNIFKKIGNAISDAVSAVEDAAIAVCNALVEMI